MALSHPQSFLAVLAHIERAMDTESTVRELAVGVSSEQAAFLADAADWLREIVAARPAIQPAREWRNPTQVRRAVAERTGAAREFVGRKRGRR
jgi:hypothetical protein